MRSGEFGMRNGMSEGHALRIPYSEFRIRMFQRLILLAGNEAVSKQQSAHSNRKRSEFSDA